MYQRHLYLIHNYTEVISVPLSPFQIQIFKGRENVFILFNPTRTVAGIYYMTNICYTELNTTTIIYFSLFATIL